MNIEGIDIKDIEFGEPVEEREPNYRDGYIQAIHRTKNIIDSKQKEIEILKNKLNLIKNNIDTITKKEILDIIENYTGFFGKGSGKE